jgi:uncharacterized membrane protein
MKRHFITGLVILLPLVITLAILLFLVNVLTEPFVDLVSPLLLQIPFLPPSAQLIRYGSKLVILIFLFIFTLGLGAITRWFLLNLLLSWGNKLLHKIPLINTVYKTIQDIIKTLFASDNTCFKQVVMVPFPSPDVYVLGLVAKPSPSVCCNAAQEELISVFIPTTPNPTTGFLLMFKASDLRPVSLSTEEALKYIISCGVIAPNPHPPSS